MASRKQAAAKLKSATNRHKVSAVAIDLDQLELLYSRARLSGGKRDGRDDGKRDDGDGIRRDDRF